VSRHFGGKSNIIICVELGTNRDRDVDQIEADDISNNARTGGPVAAMAYKAGCGLSNVLIGCIFV
jgi:hypothetical protein